MMRIASFVSRAGFKKVLATALLTGAFAPNVHAINPRTVKPVVFKVSCTDLCTVSGDLSTQIVPKGKRLVIQTVSVFIPSIPDNTPAPLVYFTVRSAQGDAHIRFPVQLFSVRKSETNQGWFGSQQLKVPVNEGDAADVTFEGIPPSALREMSFSGYLGPVRNVEVSPTDLLYTGS